MVMDWNHKIASHLSWGAWHRKRPVRSLCFWRVARFSVAIVCYLSDGLLLHQAPPAAARALTAAPVPSLQQVRAAAQCARCGTEVWVQCEASQQKVMADTHTYTRLGVAGISQHPLQCATYYCAAGEL
jgi:hypothetical protein